MDLRFTENEKRIIKQMINAKTLDERNTKKYFYSDDYIAIEISEYFSDMKIVFSKETTIEVQTSCFDRVCELVFLFIKLESLNLIAFVYHLDKSNSGRFIYNKEKHVYDKMLGYGEIMDNSDLGFSLSNNFFIANVEIAQKIYKFANSSFYISNELREIVKCNFTSFEQKRHKTTTCISIIAIVVAILLGLIGLFKEPILYLLNLQ